jgi:hypothetical protein
MRILLVEDDADPGSGLAARYTICAAAMAV